MTPTIELPPSAPGFQVHHLGVQGVLRDSVAALIAVEIHGAGPIPLAIAPHESLMLSVQFGRSGDPIEEKGEHGSNTSLTGIRQWTGTFNGTGNCVSLFALLTPLGSVQLLDSQPLATMPRIRAPLAALLDRGLTRELESRIALADGLDAKLGSFAGWLEARATNRRRQSTAALRAGCAAMRLRAEPNLGIDEIADEQHISRRQLERDFRRWVGTSPHHLAQVARVQLVSRMARSGASLAHIAADVGFADQAHMSRVVREMTGLTPLHFVRSQRTPLATGFRHATGGGTVYL